MLYVYTFRTHLLIVCINMSLQTTSKKRLTNFIQHVVLSELEVDFLIFYETIISYGIIVLHFLCAVLMLL